MLRSTRCRICRKTPTYHDCLMPGSGRGRHHSAELRIHYLGQRIIRAPITWLPEPSEAGSEGPTAVAVGHPSPRIARHPHVASAGIERPGTVLERAPVSTDEIGLPDIAVARDIQEAAVIIQIGHAVAVWRRTVCGSNDRVLIVIVGLLSIP